MAREKRVDRELYTMLCREARKYKISYVHKDQSGKNIWKPYKQLKSEIEAIKNVDCDKKVDWEIEKEIKKWEIKDIYGEEIEKSEPVQIPEDKDMAKPKVIETQPVTDPFSLLIRQIVVKELEGKIPDPVEAVCREIVIKAPLQDVKIDGLTHKVFDKVLRLASQRLNVLMVGPAGCGKTQLAAQVAKALNLPFDFISCSSGTSESQLLGWLLPLREGGVFTYHPAPFIKAYENGGVFLLDEIDSADANLMTVINAALANGHISIPHRIENNVVVKHPDFVCLAAANTFGHGANRQYVGRNQLDAATLDRFRTGLVVMDYDEKIEGATVPAELLTWGRQVRGQIAAHGLRRILSTRFLQQAAQMMKAYPDQETMETVKAGYYADWTPEEKQKVGA